MTDSRSLSHDKIESITRAANEARSRALGAMLARLWSKITAKTADPALARFA